MGECVRPCVFVCVCVLGGGVRRDAYLIPVFHCKELRRYISVPTPHPPTLTTAKLKQIVVAGETWGGEKKQNGVREEGEPLLHECPK